MTSVYRTVTGQLDKNCINIIQLCTVYTVHYNPDTICKTYLISSLLKIVQSLFVHITILGNLKDRTDVNTISTYGSRFRWFYICFSDFLPVQ